MLCININSQEYKNLLIENNNTYSEYVLKSKITEWQELNNTNKIPSLKEIGLINNIIKKHTFLLDKLSNQFNFKYEWDNTINVAGKFENNTVILNPNLINQDTLFHEFIHPFINQIKNNNPVLFNDLLNETKRKYSQKYETFKGVYKSENINEEFITQVLGELATNKEFNNSILNRIYKLISKLINKLFSTIINPDDLKNKTLNDLVNIIVSNKQINVNKTNKTFFQLLKKNPVKINENETITSFHTSEFSNKIINTITAKVYENFRSNNNTIKQELENVIKEYQELYSLEKLDNSNFFNTDYFKNLSDEEFLNDKLVNKFNDINYIFTNDLQTIRNNVLNKLSLFENAKTINQEQIEEKTDEFGGNYEKGYEEIGGEESMSKIIKEYISLQLHETLDEFGNQVEYAVDGNIIYNILEKTLSNSDNTDEMLVKMQYLSEYNPELKTFYDKFIKDVGLDENNKPTKKIQIFNALISNFKKSKFEYYKIISSNEDFQIINSNLQKSIESTKSLWQNNYENLKNKNQLSTNDKGYNFLFFSEINNQGKLEIEFENIKFNENEIINEIYEYFLQIGFVLHPSFIKINILKNIQNNIDFNKIENEKTKTDLLNYVNNNDELFLLKDFLNIYLGFNQIDTDLFLSNKFEKEINQLVISNNLFDEKLGTTTFLNAEKKSVYNYQFATFNYKLFKSFRNFNKSLVDIKKYFETSENYFYKRQKKVLLNNFLLKQPQEIRNVIFNNLTTDRIDGFEDLTFGKFKEQDLKRFITILSNKVINKKNIYLNQIPEEYHKLFETTGTQQYNQKISFKFHYPMVLEASNTADILSLPQFDLINNYDYFIDALYNNVEQQHKRINKVRSEIELLNKGIKIDKNSINIDVIEGYHNAEPDKIPRGLQFFEYLGSEKNSNLYNKLKELENLSIIDNPQEIKNLIKEEYNKQLQNVNEEMNKNYWLNDIFYRFSFYDLMSGDLSLNYKDKIDFTKRNKGNNAANKSGLTEGTYGSKIFKEPKAYIDSKTLETEEYNKEKFDLGLQIEVDPADAQSYGTIKRFFDSKLAYGELNKHGEEIFQKILDFEEPTKEEIFGDNGLLQNDNMFISEKTIHVDNIRYVKTSTTYLSKQLTSYKNKLGNIIALPHRKWLHDVREWMENNNYSIISPESANKKAKINVEQDLDPKTWVYQESDQLENQYQGRQVESPSNKLRITESTQQLWLLISEQNTPEARELVKIYTDLQVKLRNKNFQEIEKILYDKSTKNPNYNNLIEKLLDGLKASGTDTNTLKIFTEKNNNGNYIHNANLPTVRIKFEQLFLSLHSKALQTKVTGHKFTHVSSLGFKMIREKTNDSSIGKTIYTHEFENPEKAEEIENKLKNGTYILDDLKFNNNGFCEVLIPIQTAEMYGLKIGDEIPHEVLDGIGTRIPHQDAHSSIVFRVADLLPAYYGSIIVTPPAVHYLAGSDFDVDALYSNMFNLIKKTKLDKELNEKITFEKVSLQSLNIKENNGIYITNNIENYLQLVKSKYYKYIPDNNLIIEYNKQIIELKNQISDLKIQKELDKKNKKILDNIKEFYENINDIKDKIDLIKKQDLLKYLLDNNIIKQPLVTIKEYIINELPVEILENDITQSKIDLYNIKEQSIRYTPASLTALKNIVKNLKKLGLIQDKNVNMFTSEGIISMFNDLAVGKENIGPAALFNLLNSFLTYNKVDIKEFKTIDNYLKETKKDGVININIPKSNLYPVFNGIEYNTFENTLDSEQKRIQDNLSTILSAMTDNAKEQLAGMLNITIDKLPKLLTLTSLGVDLETSIIFLMNDFEKNKKDNNNFLYKNQYLDKDIYENTIFLKPFYNFSKEELIKKLKNSQITNEIDLKLFYNYRLLSQLTSFISPINSTLSLVKGFEPNFNNLKETNGLLNKLLSLGYYYNNGELKYKSSDNTSFIKPFDINKLLGKNEIIKNNLINFGKTLYNSSQFLLTQNSNFKSQYNIVKNAIKNDIEINNFRIENLENILIKTFYKQLYYLQTNKEVKPSLLLGDNQLANQLNILKSIPELKDNMIIKLLIAKKKNKDGVLTIVQSNNFTKLSNKTKEKITDDYMFLLRNKDENIRKFAENILMYIYTKDGFEFNSTSLINFLPPLSYIDLSKSLFKNIDNVVIDVDEFIMSIKTQNSIPKLSTFGWTRKEKDSLNNEIQASTVINEVKETNESFVNGHFDTLSNDEFQNNFDFNMFDNNEEQNIGLNNNEKIYFQLGKQTQSKNVVIDEVNDKKFVVEDNVYQSNLKLQSFNYDLDKNFIDKNLKGYYFYIDTTNNLFKVNDISIKNFKDLQELNNSIQTKLINKPIFEIENLFSSLGVNKLSEEIVLDSQGNIIC